MDYLQALTPDGLVHATTCDSPEGFGECFRQTMEVQGYTVTRYTPEQLAAQRQPPTIHPRTHDVQEKPPELRPCVTPDETLHPSARPAPDPPGVGAEILTPLLGRCTVMHLLTWPDGTHTAVARSTKGAGLVRDWEAAPAQRLVPPAPITPVVSPPRPLTMPSLFGDWSTP